MNDLIQRSEEVKSKIQELKQAFTEIQMPRSPFALKHFVAGQHDTEPMQYAQVVLELQIKYQNIRRAIINRKKIELRIKKLEEKNTENSLLSAELAKIDIEDQDFAMLGALREFDALYAIWKSYSKQYTRQEIDDNQIEYWNRRLTRQANQDLLASGRVGQGNQESLQQIGLAPIPELNHIRDVEKRYLDVGDTKILLVVATEKKAENGLPCIEGLETPSGVQLKVYNVWGRSIDDAYNDAAMTLLKDGADFMLTVEDDTFPTNDAFVRIWRKYRELNNPKIILGGWYPKKTSALEGTAIVVKNNKREALQADNNTHEVFTIPMGFTLFPSEAFLLTTFPFFVTTEHLTQDSFFSQKARDAGFKLLCDTSIRCKHIDRNTGEVFE